MRLASILTERQVEMFMLIAQGYTEREIAEALSVSLATVSKVVRKVYRKLEVNNAVNAIREALLSGLLGVNDLRRKPKEVSND